jgi:hypothetical protein
MLGRTVIGLWRRMRAKPVPATRYQGFVEALPGLWQMDLSDLDTAEREELAGFLRLMESRDIETLRQEPNLTRLVALKEKVKWVPFEGD